jgi:hypothetical protein
MLILRKALMAHLLVNNVFFGRIELGVPRKSAMSGKHSPLKLELKLNLPGPLELSIWRTRLDAR